MSRKPHITKHKKEVAARRVAGQSVSEIVEALGINRASVIKLMHDNDTERMIAAMRAMQADKLLEMYDLVLQRQIDALRTTKDGRELRAQFRSAMRLLTMDDHRGGGSRGGGNPALMAQQIQIDQPGGGFTIKQLLQATRGREDDGTD